jgi:sterol desaturase/sphingolipid hydroxylase (fatty acid hydroxylase superfamily)
VNALPVDMESLLRLSMFLGFFILFALLEWLFPKRPLQYPKTRRWSTNIAIAILNTALLRLLLPVAGAGAAILAGEQNIGLFNNLNLAGEIEVMLFLLIFDLTIYLQHRLFHQLNPLWRLHRMHHTDPDYDLTTGNRFHPLSILISGLIKIGLILMMGPSVAAVIFAEILLNVTSMFNHSNIRIPPQADRWLRLFIVTPDMHRVHHSSDPLEHNRNFGFNFPWWDRLFRSYLDQPAQGHDGISIGIQGFQDDGSIRLGQLLQQPLQKPRETRP